MTKYLRVTRGMNVTIKMVEKQTRLYKKSVQYTMKNKKPKNKLGHSSLGNRIDAILQKGHGHPLNYQKMFGAAPKLFFVSKFVFSTFSTLTHYFWITY